eukprot:403362908
MRLSAKTNNAQALKKLLVVGISLFPIAELGSRYVRDTYYWPIVRQIYLEVKDQHREVQKKLNNPFNLSQMLMKSQQAQQALQVDTSNQHQDSQSNDNQFVVQNSIEQHASTDSKTQEEQKDKLSNFDGQKAEILDENFDSREQLETLKNTNETYKKKFQRCWTYLLQKNQY